MMEAGDYLRFLLALLVVFGLIGLLAFVARRFRLGGTVAPGGGRRLEIVEVRALDTRRRLVLIRRDRVEHLLVLAPDHTTVVERNIQAGTREPERPQGEEPR
jgi:flagellar protein FliO/FliZ